MGDFSLVGGAPYALQAGFDYSTTSGFTITSGAANTVGSYSEILSAANNTLATEEVFVYIRTPGNTTDATFLVNIALDTGNEVILSNLFGWSSGTANRINIALYNFPLKIPAGVRISAACQSSAATQTCDVHLIRLPKSNASSAGMGKVTTYGANTGDSGGTSVARSSAHTFGSWVEIDASVANRIKGFVVAGIRPVTSWGDGQMTYDVGVGSAGNEEVVYSGHLIKTSSAEDTLHLTSPFISENIAAGERVAIRAQSVVSNTDFDLDYIIYGIS